MVVANINRHLMLHSTLSILTICSSFFVAFPLFLFLLSHPFATRTTSTRGGDSPSSSTSWGGPDWEKRVSRSKRCSCPSSVVILVTGTAGFIVAHVSIDLKRCGDGVLGLDNFNRHYEPNLKRARQRLLYWIGVFVVDGDINDATLLRKLFNFVPFSHLAHTSPPRPASASQCR